MNHRCVALAVHRNCGKSALHEPLNKCFRGTASCHASHRDIVSSKAAKPEQSVDGEASDGRARVNEVPVPAVHHIVNEAPVPAVHHIVYEIVEKFVEN